MNTISWMPPWVEHAWTRLVEVRPVADPLYRLPGPAPHWSCRQPTTAGWGEITQGLQKAGERLRALPIRDIVESLGAVGERFRPRSSPDRQLAVEAMCATTGLSAETVHRSLDIEMDSCRPSELWAALERDLGDPLVLDGYRGNAQLRGCTRAIGPRLVAVVATGNVPGLAWLPIARALLAKAPVVLKVARGEPEFASLFVERLHRLAPVLAEAVVATYWEPGDSGAFNGAFERADCVVVYGGEKAVEAIRRYLRPTQRVMVHGHKFSGGVLTRAYLAREGAERVAELFASDIGAFDQHACIAPKVLVVEGECSEVDAFAEVLQAALAQYAADCLPGRMCPQDAASLSARRLTARWKEAAGTGRVWHGSELGWTVERSFELPPLDCGGDRYIVLVPAPNPLACVERLRERSAHLQNVVVGAVPEEMPMLAEEAALLGACRVCPPGSGASPSMIWRHDGRACLAEFIRWCDVEGWADWERWPAHEMPGSRATAQSDRVTTAGSLQWRKFEESE
ncbi:acyl-CoA reductase [Myxococcota bacterium]